MLAVELDQFGAEAVAYLDHDFFTAAQKFVGEHSTPIFGCEDQMGMQAIDDGAPTPDIGMGFPSR
ncbi:hypothetical protein GCM10020216_049920 [Nonomuraea helvata]